MTKKKVKALRTSLTEEDIKIPEALLPLIPAWRQRWIENTRRTAPMTTDAKIDAVGYLKRAYEGVNGADGKPLKWHGVVRYTSSNLAMAVGSCLAMAYLWLLDGGSGRPGLVDGLGSGREAAEKVRRRFRAAGAAFVAEKARESGMEPESHAVVLEHGLELAFDLCATCGGAEKGEPDAATEGEWMAVADEYLVATQRNHGRAWVGSNLWSSWCCYLSFFKDIKKIEDVDWSKWQVQEWLCENTGPRMEHRAFTVVADFPRRQCHDDRGRLHSLDGPAFAWADGRETYWINGVRVTKRVVMAPDTLTVEEIKGERDAEVRRVMRQQFGEGRYLAETGAKVVHMDHEGARKGAAPRCLMEDGEGRRFLVGTDGSTRRVYYMEVPPEIVTCAAAHTYLCGFDESRILVKS